MVASPPRGAARTTPASRATTPPHRPATWPGGRSGPSWARCPTTGSGKTPRSGVCTDPLKDFVGAVLGKERLHRFADPLGACSVNVFVDGGEHGWHFDESEFTVTLMLQPPESGGAFEYVPRIRGREDEQAIVGAVLNGGRAGVVELPFTAGALLVFGGRQTLHRVTRVHGARPRLVPVLCYAERPGLRNSEAVRKLFWGRTGTEDDPGNRRAKA